MNVQQKAGYEAFLSGKSDTSCKYPSSNDIENFNHKRYDWMLGYYFGHIQKNCPKKDFKWEDFSGK